MEKERMYTDLAWTWPIISPPENYEEEAAQFSNAILDHSKIEIKTLLDMGCGGGHLDVHLKHDFDVTGADISEGMLSNAKKLNPEVRYVNGDMRTLKLDEKFDAVIIADAILYMQSQEELKAAFQTAYEHLKPGGAFCTYVEEWAGKKKKNRTYVHTGKKGNIEITLIEDYFDPDPEDTTFECTFVFLIRKKGVLRVELDHHLCGIFPLEMWRRLLEDVGFGVNETVYDADDGYPMFVGVKPR